MMAIFSPDDLLDPAVRRLAIELGIPEAGKNKAQLVQEIQALQPTLCLLSVPIIANPSSTPSGKRDRLGSAAIMATAFTALLTGVIAVANWKLGGGRICSHSPNLGGSGD